MAPQLTRLTHPPLNTTLIDLQDYQRRHDREYHRDVDNANRLQQYQHNEEHFGKLGGRFARHQKAGRAGLEMGPSLIDLESRTIPDTLCFTLKLANLLDLVLTEEFGKVYGIDASSPLSIIQDQFPVQREYRHIQDDLADHVSVLSDYCDKNYHGEARDHVLTQLKATAVPGLLMVAIDFANLFSVSLAKAYLERIRDGEHKKRL